MQNWGKYFVSPGQARLDLARVPSQLERLNRCVRRLERECFLAPAIAAELIPDHPPLLLLLEPGVAVDAQLPAALRESYLGQGAATVNSLVSQHEVLLVREI